LGELGTTPSQDGPAELQRFIQSQFNFWQKFIRDSGLKTELR
jgi:tripartite-type tricarboxylate transporter receptor subunit TctC